MSRHTRARLAPWALAFVIAMSVAACGRTVIASMDDQAITTRVRTALLNEPNLAARDIGVATVQHVVTLSGTVPTAAERDRAIAVARGAGGVSDVHSELRVQP